MIEVMTERWTNTDGTTDHVWSLWRDGSRLQIGNRHSSAEYAEAEARAYCLQTLGTEPDRMTRL